MDTARYAFAIANRGGASLVSSGDSDSIRSGYARIRSATNAATPAGVAIYSYRSANLLIGEMGVPATAALKSGRIFAEVSSTVNTGLAIVNPNNQTATINFFFTDDSGHDAGTGKTTVPSYQQIARFLDSATFKTFSGPSFQGAFSFTSDLPVGVVAIRSFYNERADFLMSTLPVIDTSAVPDTGPAVVPHFSDGGGWTTQILLVNPADNPLVGNVEFRDENGLPVVLSISDGRQLSILSSAAERSKNNDTGEL